MTGGSKFFAQPGESEGDPISKTSQVWWNTLVRAKVSVRLDLRKQIKNKRARSVVQVTECLPSKGQALRSVPSVIAPAVSSPPRKRATAT
jgi:hypothetical protein